MPPDALEGRNEEGRQGKKPQAQGKIEQVHDISIWRVQRRQEFWAIPRQDRAKSGGEGAKNALRAKADWLGGPGQSEERCYFRQNCGVNRISREKTSSRPSSMVKLKTQIS